MNDLNIKSQIIEKLAIKEPVEFHQFIKHPNGMIPDVVVESQNQIDAIIEIKGSKVQTNDYVRGTGQLLQYEGFFKNNISALNKPYSSNFKTLYLFPSDVMKNNKFSITDFIYPETTSILEINVHNRILRSIEQNEMERLRTRDWEKTIAISPYYFRDNRLFENYILLKYINKLEETIHPEKINRTKIGSELQKQIKVINDRNWRNSFITLSNLGFINENNLPTKSGVEFAKKNYSSFVAEVYFSYMKEYIDEIFYALEQLSFIGTNKDITSKIIYNYEGLDVLFLTESEGRYISSFMNILRDDFGAIEFEKRKPKRFWNYTFNNIAKKELIEQIESFTKSDKFLIDAKIKLAI